MQTSARQNYPADVPHEIDPGQYRSLPHMFDEAFARHAERPFSVCMERWMSYGELDTLSKALGAWLQSLGLEPGARVAIMLPNVPQFAFVFPGQGSQYVGMGQTLAEQSAAAAQVINEADIVICSRAQTSSNPRPSRPSMAVNASESFRAATSADS